MNGVRKQSTLAGESMLARTVLGSACILVWSLTVDAAGFDRADASTALERAICSDTELAKSDEEMVAYHFGLKDSLDGADSLELLDEQRRWLRSRTRRCRSSDASCLRRLYDERIHELRVRYENLVPFVLSAPGALQGLRNACGFGNIKLADNFIVYAAGGYRGRNLDVQIDDVKGSGSIGREAL